MIFIFNQFKKEKFNQFKKGKNALFLLSICSYFSSFLIFFPVDILLILIIYFQKKRYIYYSFWAAFVSSLGGLTGFLIGFFLSDYFQNYLNYMQYDFLKFQSIYHNYGYLAVFMGAFFPLLPYKLIVFSSGILQLNIYLFFLFSFIGRFIRFFLLSFIIYYFHFNIQVINSFIKNYMHWKFFFIKSILISLLIFIVFQCIFQF